MSDGYIDAPGGLPRGRGGRVDPPSAAAPAPGEPVTDDAPRCWRCNRRLAEYLSRPWSLRCHSCKAQNRATPGAERVPDLSATTAQTATLVVPSA